MSDVLTLDVHSLPNSTLSGLKVALEVTRNYRDLQLVKEWAEHPEKWRMPKVSLDTFLDSPYYLGIGNNVYPSIRKMARNIIEGGYSEGVVVAGIGSGKSFLSEILACYACHVLLCMKDPHAFYNLLPDKPITIMNMGTTATQAFEVVFSGIKAFIEKSPFFMGFLPTILGGSIRFHKEKIMLMSGNSKSTTPLGYNIFYAILDEAAFYMDNENKSVAEDIYSALQRRIVSRFGYDGLLMMISSPRYTEDFIMRKLQDAKTYTGRIYGKQMPTWKCKSNPDLSNLFYFNARKGLIEDTAPVSSGTVNKVQDAFDEEAEIWEIPGEYKMSFEQNPEKAKRDFGAVPSLTLQAFFPHPEIVSRCFKKDVPAPYDKEDHLKLPPAKRTSYYIHIDLALNTGGKGDAAGFCMAHLDGFDTSPNGDKKKRVAVDILQRITCGPTGKINFEDIRNKIYALKAMGYPIQLVTLDGFQSVDFMQILTSKGYKADYLSVDRDIDPYNTLKEIIYDNRLISHDMPKAEEELCRLEIIKGMKIDHPPGGSKDVADALCGAVFNVMTHSSIAEMGVMGVSISTDSGGAPKTINQKEEHYRRLQAMADKGLLGK